MRVAAPDAHRLSGFRTPGSGALLFTLLCLVWGSTWLSLKVGISTVPPLIFTAARFLVASVPLLAWAAARGRLRVPVATILPGAVLMIAVNYGMMAWGMTRVASGIAAVINLATVPIGTLVLGVAHGQARWSARAAAAVLTGAAGLAVLFSPGTGAAQTFGMQTIGMAAIAVGAACYAWGAILTKERPVADPLALAGWQSLLGGVLLASAALLTEPLDASTLAALQAPAALGNLAFLAIAAVIGGSVYLMLLARWDAGRVATYAYVCPLIALAEGAALDAQLPSRAELAAIALLLVAIRFSLTAHPAMHVQARRS
jgi:drug/metabolite transporter (DMT)-like permease